MDRVHELTGVDGTWTLFLDRDGVVNRKLKDDYVKSLSELEILPGVIEAVYVLSNIFGKIIVVTNQQGIAKGLMSPFNLEIIHQYIQKEVENGKGFIDAFYHCPHFKEECSFCRKPGIGMAIMAKEDFPTIDYKKSIIVGDSESDMDFGNKLGMMTVFIGHKSNHITKKVDIFVNSLLDFSKIILKYKKDDAS